MSFSRWLRRERSARYATQDEAREAFRLAGMYITQSEYSQWEGGSRTPRLTNPKRRWLEEFFGGAVESGGADLASAIADLAQAVRELTGAQVDAFQSFAELLGETRGRAPTPGDMPVGSGHEQRPGP